MIILHNVHDQTSRQFVSSYGEGCTVIDWYGDPGAVSQYLAAGNPSPSAFPSIVDEATKTIIRKPDTPDDLTAALEGA